MRLARYFYCEFQSSYLAMKKDKSLLTKNKCRFDRMPLLQGEFHPHSLTQQRNPKETPIATHKLTCKDDFDIQEVSFFVIEREKFLINDWQKMSDLYIINLHAKGEYIEKA